MKSRLLGAVSAYKKQTLLEEVFSMRTSINTSIIRLVLLVGGCLVAATVNAAGIQRMNLDGSGLTALVTGLGNPSEPVSSNTPLGIALDVGGGQMYWTDFNANKVQRANLDGSGVTDLVSGLTDPMGIALDVGGGQMYWTSDNIKVQRAKLDGSDVTVLPGLSFLGAPSGIALDVGGGQMYLADMFISTIERANLDGSGLTTLVVELTSSPFGIALDVGGGQMYWTSSSTIRRANLDGSGITDLVTGESAWDIALDLAGGQMYWTDAFAGKVQRANLDGSGVTELVTGLDSPRGLALDLDAGHIYFTSAVPLPASLWLFGTGLLGMIGIARRKKAA